VALLSIEFHLERPCCKQAALLSALACGFSRGTITSKQAAEELRLRAALLCVVCPR